MIPVGYIFKCPFCEKPLYEAARDISSEDVSLPELFICISGRGRRFMGANEEIRCPDCGLMDPRAFTLLFEEEQWVKADA